MTELTCLVLPSKCCVLQLIVNKRLDNCCLLATPEQIAEQNQRNDQVLNTFWSGLMPILDNAPDQSMLQDVIVTTLKVPYEQLPDSWINTEQKVSQMNLSMLMFDLFVFGNFQFRLADSLCENVVDNSFRLNVRKRQFKSFNEQMKVVAIPVIGSC